MIWSSIVTIPVAIVQAICSLLLLLLVTLIAIRVEGFFAHVMTEINNRHLLPNGTAEITHGGITMFLVVVVLVCLGYFIVCVLLCKGVCEKKPGLIITFVIFGFISLALNVWSWTTNEHGSFPEDKKPLYLGIYGLYLVFLIINIAEIKSQKKKKQGRAVVAPHVLYSPQAPYSPGGAPYSPQGPYSLEAPYSPQGPSSLEAPYSPQRPYSAHAQAY